MTVTVRAVSGALNKAKIPNIPRQRGLSRLYPPDTQPLPKLFLAGNGLRIDKLEYCGLPIGLHNYALTNG